MKSKLMLMRIRRRKVWIGRLMLAGLLCLEAWVVGRFVSDWSSLARAASSQAYAADVATAFSGR